LIESACRNLFPDRLRAEVSMIGLVTRFSPEIVREKRAVSVMLSQPFEKTGGPGGTRTPNQAVMSGRL
jgi:hypothetical protein